MSKWYIGEPHQDGDWEREAILQHNQVVIATQRAERAEARVEELEAKNESFRRFIESCSEIDPAETIMKDATVVRGNIWKCYKNYKSNASMFRNWLIEIVSFEPSHWRHSSTIKKAKVFLGIGDKAQQEEEQG